MQLLKKILSYPHENGMRQFIHAALRTLKNTLFYYKKEVIGCLVIDEQRFVSSSKIPVSVQQAQAADVPELKTLTSDYRKRDFSAWIRDNYIFYIAKAHDPKNLSDQMSTFHSDHPIVGYVCVCQAKKDPHPLVSILKLTDTDYWAVDAFTHPQFRGKGINSAIASEFLAEAKRQGMKRGYGTILFKNKASRKSYSSGGEKEIAVFTTWTILGMTFRRLKRNRGYDEYFN